MASGEATETIEMDTKTSKKNQLQQKQIQEQQQQQQQQDERDLIDDSQIPTTSKLTLLSATSIKTDLPTTGIIGRTATGTGIMGTTATTATIAIPTTPPTPTASTTPTSSIDMSPKQLTSTSTLNTNTQDNLHITHISVSNINTTANNIVPAIPSTSRKLFHDAAALHGGDDTTNFLQHELANTASTQLPQTRLRSPSSTLDATVSRQPSAAGKHEKKIGHRRVDEGGEVTYKKIQSKQIMGSIQLGIQHTVGSLASKPKRDLLMNDFWEMETISFPPDGSSITPAHHYNDFRFKVYAPIAFRYFRDLFGIAPDDFLMSICAAPLRQLSNPGASGSIFYLTDDDEFIIKTVQKKECEFLQKLLPGYYMNLSQNPRTLLPKFFGLYCFHYNSKNVRLVAMNNLLPSDIKMHAKYDLKGSTFRRKASKAERQKVSPTFKDLDFMEHHPNGIFLETDKYNALMKTIQRDCMVLESFQIMDYSMLMGIHNLDIAQKEKREERIRNARAKLQRTDEIREIDDPPDLEQTTSISVYNPATPMAAGTSAASLTVANALSGRTAAGIALNRSRSMNRQRLVAHSTAMESITADMDTPIDEDDDVPAGGIPARSENDERLILYIGIIDILQSYRLEKKIEHTFKSIIYNGDTVSVCRPSFYAQRFQNFMGKTVFKKTPTFPLKHSPSKRKTSTASTMRTPQRTPSQSISSPGRPNLVSGSSTPPPAFDDISEEDLTATSSTAGLNRYSINSRHLAPQRSYISSNRSVISNATSDYSDDEVASGSGGRRTPLRARSPNQMHHHHQARLSKTSVQLTTIGCSEDEKDSGVGGSGSSSGEKFQRNTIILNNGENDNHDVVTAITTGNGGDGSKTSLNNEQIITNTKTTTVVNAMPKQKYTTTLVVNDVIR